jgi:heat shock protein HslJ
VSPAPTAKPVALKTYEIDEGALLTGPIDGSWILVSELDAKGTPIEADGDFRTLAHPVTVTFDDDELTSSACGVVGTVEGGYGDFEFADSQECYVAQNARPILSPREFDDPRAEALGDILESADTARGDGQVLELSGPGGVVTFERPDRVGIQSLVGKTWNLQSMDRGNEAVLFGTASQLTFDPDGTVSGSTECRDFTASWALVDGVVTVGEATPSATPCPFGTEQFGNSDVNDARMLAALQDGTAYDLNGGILTVVDRDNGYTLRYGLGEANGDGVSWGMSQSRWDLALFGEHLTAPPSGEWQLVTGVDHLGYVRSDQADTAGARDAIYTFSSSGFTTGIGCRETTGSFDGDPSEGDGLFTVTSRGSCVFDRDSTVGFDYVGVAERTQTALESAVELRAGGGCFYAIHDETFLRFVKAGTVDEQATFCGRL